MSRCRCGGYPAKSGQSVRPWRVAGLWVDVCERRLLRLSREGVPACLGRSARFCGRCPWLSARSAVRVPASTDIWRTASARRMSFCMSTNMPL